MTKISTVNWYFPILPSSRSWVLCNSHQNRNIAQIAYWFFFSFAAVILFYNNNFLLTLDYYLSLYFISYKLKRKRFLFRNIDHQLTMPEHMRRFVRFGTICTILKTWKKSVEECYFLQPATLLNFTTLLHGCFSRIGNCKWCQIAQSIITYKTSNKEHD